MLPLSLVGVVSVHNFHTKKKYLEQKSAVKGWVRTVSERKDGLRVLGFAKSLFIRLLAKPHSTSQKKKRLSPLDRGGVSRELRYAPSGALLLLLKGESALKRR